MTKLEKGVGLGRDSPDDRKWHAAGGESTAKRCQVLGRGRMISYRRHQEGGVENDNNRWRGGGIEGQPNGGHT